MKRVLLFAAVLLTLVLIFGCSETPQITGPDNSTNLGPLVQRPEFIDTRPPAAIAMATVKPPADYIPSAYKPPKPPPDTGGGDPNPNPAHKYAYVVGISDYEGTANDLQYCDDDAQEMKAYFQSQGFTIRMDLDRNATAAAVEAGLNWLISVAVPGDEIAFAYSGHGASAPQGYGSSLISTDLYYLTHGWVMQKFNAVNCTKKHISLDACVIGDFQTDCANGTMMALASNNTNSYDAPGLNNGAYTYYWIAGATTQGKIYAEDIATYAEAGMKAWASQYHVRVSPVHKDMYTGKLDI